MQIGCVTLTWTLCDLKSDGIRKNVCSVRRFIRRRRNGLNERRMKIALSTKDNFNVSMLDWPPPATEHTRSTWSTNDNGTSLFRL